MMAAPAADPYPAEDGWAKAGACRWRVAGGSYELVWPVAAVRALVSHVYEEKDALKARVQFQGLDGSHILVERLNLLAGTTKRQFINSLEAVVPFKEQRDKAGVLPADHPIWSDIVEQLVLVVERREVEGEPFVDFADLAEPEQQTLLISGFLFEGLINVVFARGGSGKSWMALLAAAALITGEQVIPGIAPAKLGPVLYLDWEVERDDVNRRLRPILCGLGHPPAPPPGAFIYQRMDRALADSAARIAQIIARFRPRLVVVDSIGAACGTTVNDDAAAQRMMNVVRTWAGVTVLLLGHTAKHDEDEEKEATAEKKLMGANAYENRARNMWQLVPSRELRGNEREIAFALIQRKENVGVLRSFGLHLISEGPDPKNPTVVRVRPYDIEGDYSLSTTMSLRDRVYHELKTARAPLSIKELVDLTGASEKRLRTLLHEKMASVVVNVDAGRTGRGHEGRWALRTREDRTAPTPIRYAWDR